MPLDQLSTSTPGVPQVRCKFLLQNPSLIARQNTRTLCQSSRPPHTFPTTYPPPLRPSSEIPPVEWHRTPALSSSISASTIDIDLLCAQFSRLLVIDENPARSSETQTSIFSFPIIPKPGNDTAGPHTSRTRRKHCQVVVSTKVPTLRSTPPKVTKPRQLSVPPSLPSLTSRLKPIPRKASAPTHVPVSSAPSAANRHITLGAPQSPSSILTVGDLDPDSSHCSTTPPLYPQPLPDSTPGRSTDPSDNLSRSLAGPATPPTFPPGLFPEPLVVSSTPIQLSPQQSITQIIDPFDQFQLQYDYFLTPSLVSPLDHSGMPVGLTMGSFSKNVLDARIWSGRPFHCVPMAEPSESNLLDISSVF